MSTPIRGLANLPQVPTCRRSLGDFGGCSSSAGGWQGWEQKWAEQLNALRREHQVVLFQPRSAFGSFFFREK